MGRGQPDPDDPVSSGIKLATEGSPAKGSPVNKSKHFTLLAWPLFVTILSLATKGFLTAPTYQSLRTLKTHVWGPSQATVSFCTELWQALSLTHSRQHLEVLLGRQESKLPALSLARRCLHLLWRVML